MFFVRSAGENDLEAVRALLAETWRATYEPFHGAEKVAELSGRWHSIDALRANLARPASEFIVADDGSRIAGMAYASVTAKDTVTLHQLYVHPEFQGRGIGRDLFAEIESCFDGARLMRLEVEQQNAGAIAFYRRHGFLETGRTEHCGGDGSAIPALVLEKALV